MDFISSAVSSANNVSQSLSRKLASASSTAADVKSRTNFSREVVTLNFGLRHEFTETRILIVSLGHEIVSPDDELALIGYFGMQLVY